MPKQDPLFTEILEMAGGSETALAQILGVTDRAVYWWRTKGYIPKTAREKINFAMPTLRQMKEQREILASGAEGE